METEGLLELGYENTFNKMISLQSCAPHLHLIEPSVWISIKGKLLQPLSFCKLSLRNMLAYGDCARISHRGKI